MLLQAGFSVHGFDVHPPSIAKFSSMRGRGSSSVVEAVKDADVVNLMVANVTQAADVLFGQGAAEGTVIHVTDRPLTDSSDVTWRGHLSLVHCVAFSSH